MLVDSNQKDYSPVQQWYQVGDDTRGAHTFDVFPRPPPASTGLPVNTRMKGYYRHPASLFDGTVRMCAVGRVLCVVFYQLSVCACRVCSLMLALPSPCLCVLAASAR